MNIIGTKIWMTRGDSESITVGIYDDELTLIPFVVGDSIKFTARDKVTMEKVISKTITTFDVDGKAIVNILPTDTDGLEFKTYVYDIQFTSAAGAVTTLVKPSDLTIELEVSYE